MADVITMTADLKANEKSNLRSAPGITGGFIKTMTGPIHIETIGEKQLKDGYYWSQVVYPEPGWIAWTTSYANVKLWGTPAPAPTPTSKVVGVAVVDPTSVVLKHEDGSETKLL